MDRRQAIKSLLSGAIGATLISSNTETGTAREIPNLTDPAVFFQSDWENFPDMTWTGEDFWAQRLQDFAVKDGELRCLTHGADRAIHLLTHQLSAEPKPFQANLSFRFLSTPSEIPNNEDFAGFRLGIKGRFDDYRSAIMTGQGIDAGVTRSGYLFIGGIFAKNKIDASPLSENVRLSLTISATSRAVLKATDKTGAILAQIVSDEFSAVDYSGNIALVSHFNQAQFANVPTMAVTKFEVKGERLSYHPAQTYGAIYFAQYTVNKSLLKLTAQLAPVDLPGGEAVLSVRSGGSWRTIAVTAVHPLSRTATFRVEKWNPEKPAPYRVSYQIPLKDGQKRTYQYDGTIAAEPSSKEKIKALAFSCNWDWGFPDAEVVNNAGKHRADMALFLGDQFYEPNGGFGVQVTPLEKSSLDYLRKWYQFGWSYRELFRDIPMIAILDDHDVYHGNIWGSGGRPTISTGGGAARQDSGGYKMPAEWVNMAQLTQTSHMPDPFDPRTVAQNITVYYTSWQYAGISFGIIEDRKFKSAPKDILPAEADVFNGFAQNPDFDTSKIKELEARLLGERQILFLRNWLVQENSQFRVLLSATPFCCLQTLPAGTKNDQITPDLPIPAKGEYIKGDALTRDMDSNGFPHRRRDEIVKLLGQNISLHVVGDQHLASVVQYGTDDFRDGSFCFAVPALCNIWPRRWYPPVDDSHQPLPDKPRYTGNFEDGFGNKMTVYAAVSPHRVGREPAELYDKGTGYGVVEFNRKTNLIKLSCYPRFVDPTAAPNDQYEGFPIVIENLAGRKKTGT